MNDQVTTLGSAGYGVSQQERNRVLRNTYWLLALSLLPTVLGAWLGVATGITRSLSGGLGLIVFLGGAFGFMFAIEKTKHSAAGTPVLLGFTFFMGHDQEHAGRACKGGHDQLGAVLEAQDHADHARQHQAHEEGKAQQHGNPSEDWPHE